MMEPDPNKPEITNSKHQMTNKFSITEIRTLGPPAQT